jgi:hypothetical protein
MLSLLIIGCEIHGGIPDNLTVSGNLPGIFLKWKCLMAGVVRRKKVEVMR